MTQPKVSIVVPVYNVEKYIEKCLRTLFEQTLDSLEYIFIDDCSPDNSVNILQRVIQDYPARASQVKIIRHTTNRGVAQSRQDGVDAATGEYIIHCDPDDWLELDMYEQLYNKAKNENLDLVLCDFINEYGNYAQLDIQRPLELTSDSILGSICGSSPHMLHGGLWNKLFKACHCRRGVFTNGICFCEDVLFLMQIMSASDLNIGYIPNAFYHYRKDNIHSLTANNDISPAQIESDLKLADCVSKIPSLSQPMKQAFISKLLVRAFSSEIYSDKEYKARYYEWRTFVKSNKQIGYKWYPFLWCASVGRHIFALRSYQILSKIQRLIKRSVHTISPTKD